MHTHMHATCPNFWVSYIYIIILIARQIYYRRHELEQSNYCLIVTHIQRVHTTEVLETSSTLLIKMLRDGKFHARHECYLLNCLDSNFTLKNTPSLWIIINWSNNHKVAFSVGDSAPV